MAGNELADQYLVAWKRTSPTHPFIQVQEITRSGNFPDRNVLIAGADHDYPAIFAGSSGDFLVTFEASALDFGIFGHLWGIRIYLPVVLENR